MKEIKTLTRAEVKEVHSKGKTYGEEICIDGYPTFNTCAHTFIDLSHLKDHNDDEYQHTLSVKLPNNRHVTFCVMQLGETQNCVDIQYYQDGKYIGSHDNLRTWAMGMKQGVCRTIENFNLIGVVVDIKEEDK